MRSFADTARKRIRDKSWLKDWAKRGEDGMVKYAVSDSGLMNMSLFWVLNVKRDVFPVFVSFIFQIPMELKNVFFKLPFKFSHVLSFLFVAFEFIPRQKEIF